VSTSPGQFHLTAPAPAESIVPVPFDAVWPRIVAFFANANVPIQTVEKASGLIASQRLTLSPDQIGSWLHCETLDLQEWMQATFTSTFNVFARPTGDSTYVRVNVAITAVVATDIGPLHLDCVSKGRFEQQLLASLATPMVTAAVAVSAPPPLAAGATPLRDSSATPTAAVTRPTNGNASLTSTAGPQQSSRAAAVLTATTVPAGKPAPISNSRRVAVVPTQRPADATDTSSPSVSASGPESPVASESIGAPKSEADRQNGWTAFQNGRAYLASHEWSKAERWLREAVRLDGSNPQYHAELGQVYMTLERWPEAEAAFTAAVLLDVDNARYRQLLKESRSH
jgi:hypothetical protein